MHKTHVYTYIYIYIYIVKVPKLANGKLSVENASFAKYVIHYNRGILNTYLDAAHEEAAKKAAKGTSENNYRLLNEIDSLQDEISMYTSHLKELEQLCL